MQTVRKLLLLLAAAIATIALGASSAAAQTPTLEVVKESDGTHCPAVTDVLTGGCPVELSGEVALISHFGGIEISVSDCVVNLEARFDEDGEGYVYSASYAQDATHVCTQSPCGIPWRIHMDEFAAELEKMTFEICWLPNGGGANSRCLVQPPINDSTNHAYDVSFNDVAGIIHLGGACELTSGRFYFIFNTAHPAIEILHTVDP
jgi:hypothetical protein